MLWSKISPDDDDAEEQGADQLDLVAEQSDVEDEAGKGGSAVRLGEDGDKDEGGHESAGQVADGHRQQKRVGQVAALLASVLPVEEDHDGCQTTQDAEDNTERYDDLGQQRDQCCLKHRLFFLPSLWFSSSSSRYDDLGQQGDRCCLKHWTFFLPSLRFSFQMAAPGLLFLSMMNCC